MTATEASSHELQQPHQQQPQQQATLPQQQQPPAVNTQQPPSCFITSVTSITSLDTGYQGDGESSRPASRGAELSSPPGIKPHPPPPAVAVPPAPAAPDPMTDSDFFTESDADGHDEARSSSAPSAAPGGGSNSAPGGGTATNCVTGGGDRRAQVIDGTLYNEAQHLQQRCPSFTASSEMESSGVFSDLEPRRPDDGDADVDDGSAAHDLSPDGSTKSVSEPSQVKDSPDSTGTAATAIPEETTVEDAERTTVSEKSPAPAQQVATAVTDVKVTGEGTPQGGQRGGKEATPQPVLKKFKMPKRNVVSKIKAMIESPTLPAEDHESQRTPRAKKGGRWDAVMNKIAQGQAEQRSLKTSLKEVRSKVFATITTTPPQQTARKPVGKGDSASTPQSRPRSRRARTRASSTASQQQQTGGVGLPPSSQSSLHSSVSDVSVGVGRPSPPQSCKSVSSLRSNKKQRADASRTNSPFGDVGVYATSSHQMARRPPPPKNGAPDMKTPTVRKQPSRRAQPVTATPKPAPLRDHNRVVGSGAPLKEAQAVKLQRSSPTQYQPPEGLLQQLRHNAVGFEAFGVLVQYLVNDLEAFEHPQLKREVEIMRSEVTSTKHELNEAYIIQKQLEEKICQEKATYENLLSEAEKKRTEEIEELVSRQEQQLAEYEKKLHDQTEQTRCRYETELSRLERLHAEREVALLEDGQERLEQAKAEHQRLLEERERRSTEERDELSAQLREAEAEVERLKGQLSAMMNSLRQDRDTKLQMTVGRCKELEDEVTSLRTVLDLRKDELAEVRRQNAELSRDAAELPMALQKVATLQARVEDLQEQLQHKANFERQLSQENRKLIESFHQESAQKQRLSQYNEELQWKLKQNTEVVQVITQALAATPHISCNKPHEARKLFSRSPLLRRRSEANNSHTSLLDCEDTSPPASPKVKAVVEKGDSVSWVLEMDESPEATVSRLVRRAGSFRSGSLPPSAAPPRSRTLPRSGATSGRGPTGTTARPRTRTWSSSSENFISTSSGSADRATSAPLPATTTPSSLTRSLVDEVFAVSTGKSHLKRCNRDTDNFSPDEDDLHRHRNGIGAKRVNADSGASSLEGKLSPASSSSSTTGSSSSSCFVSEHNYCHLNGTVMYKDSDSGDVRALPLPPLPGSGDLALLAAACAAAHPLDAAGEAMISEETLDDDDENDAGGEDTSDGEDPPSWEDMLLPSESEG